MRTIVGMGAVKFVPPSWARSLRWKPDGPAKNRLSPLGERGGQLGVVVRHVEITGNPVIVTTSSAILRWLLEYHTARLHGSGKEKVTLREHGRIIERIEAHDADHATIEMQRHLDQSKALFAPKVVDA